MHTALPTERSRWKLLKKLGTAAKDSVATKGLKVPAPPPVFVAQAIARVRNALGDVRRYLVPPPVATYEILTIAHAQLGSHALIALGVVDALASGPQPAEELARATETEPMLLGRLLGTMASFHLIDERNGRFALSRWGQLLRDDVPGSMRAFAIYLASPWRREAMATLPEIVRTGETGMTLAHEQSLFEFLSKSPEAGRVFGQAMVSLTEMAAAAVAHAYRFPKRSRICDVGGGVGILLGVLLAKHPSLTGVLFDRQPVVDRASKTLGEWGVVERCERVGGDFFESVPAGAEVYLVKDVLHDWNDDDTRRILRTVRSAMKIGSRLLIIESVISDGPESAPARLLDLELMILTGGRKRRAGEYEQLLADAGLKMTRVLATASPSVLIEAVRAGS